MTPNLFLSDETRAWLLRAAEDLAAASVLVQPATLRSAEADGENIALGRRR